MRVRYLLSALQVLLLLTCCRSVPAPVQLELPSHNPDYAVLHYTGFTVGYDSKNKLPAWVAYELTADEVAADAATRDGKSFKVDRNAGVPQAEDSDYRKSGWSRGHMAPAADFKWSEQAMTETFLFTNCCPQLDRLNQGSWSKLENRVRDWARKSGAVYVVTGPLTGEHENGYIGLNHIPVPDAFYKAVLSADGNGGYQAVAFVMHNIGTSQPYPECSMTVDELESLLGLDLFQALPDEQENEAESHVDRLFWGM